jgi:hypothetical protein
MAAGGVGFVDKEPSEHKPQPGRKELAPRYTARTWKEFEDAESRSDAIERGTRTTPKTMAVRRDVLEEEAFQLDAIAHSLWSGKGPQGEALTAEQRQLYTARLMTLGVQTLVHGICYLADCLSYRETVRQKQPDGSVHVSYRRATLADTAMDATSFLAMLHDWPDKNGNVSPEDRGALDVLNQQMATLIRMIYMSHKHDDPECFGAIQFDENGLQLGWVDDVFKGEEAVFTPAHGDRRPRRLKDLAESEQALTQEQLAAARSQRRQELQQ